MQSANVEDAFISMVCWRWEADQLVFVEQLNE